MSCDPHPAWRMFSHRPHRVTPRSPSDSNSQRSQKPNRKIFTFSHTKHTNMEHTNMEKIFSLLTRAIHFRLSRSGSKDKIMFAKHIVNSIMNDPMLADKKAAIKSMEEMSAKIARQAFHTMNRYNILSFDAKNDAYVTEPVVKAIVSDVYAARHMMKVSPNMVFKLDNSMARVRIMICSRRNEPEWAFLATLWNTYAKERRVILKNQLKDDDTQNAVIGLMKLKYGPQCTRAF